MVKIPPEEIVELKDEIELAESNYKYALELRKNSSKLMLIKEKIIYLKKKLQALTNRYR